MPSKIRIIYCFQQMSRRELPNSQQFHFKNQCRESRYRATSLGAIAHGVGNVDNPFIAYMHMLQSDLPTINQITQTEGFGTIALVGVVEFLTINQGTLIVHGYNTSYIGRSGTVSCFQYLIINSAGKGVYTFLSRKFRRNWIFFALYNSFLPINQ